MRRIELGRSRSNERHLWWSACFVRFLRAGNNNLQSARFNFRAVVAPLRGNSPKKENKQQKEVQFSEQNKKISFGNCQIAIRRIEHRAYLAANRRTNRTYRRRQGRRRIESETLTTLWLENIRLKYTKLNTRCERQSPLRQIPLPHPQSSPILPLPSPFSFLD